QHQEPQKQTQHTLYVENDGHVRLNTSGFASTGSVQTMQQHVPPKHTNSLRGHTISSQKNLSGITQTIANPSNAVVSQDSNKSYSGSVPVSRGPPHIDTTPIPGTSQMGSGSTSRESLSSHTSKPYDIRLTGKRTFAKNAAENRTYQVTFNDQLRGQKLVDIHTDLRNMFEDVLDRSKRVIDPKDLVVVIVDHSGLNDSVVVPLREADQMTVDTVTDRVPMFYRAQRIWLWTIRSK
ncbi:MAG: hypothetical protein ABW185_10540, partial [Sedimenticola sp.]